MFPNFVVTARGGDARVGDADVLGAGVGVVGGGRDDRREPASAAGAAADQVVLDSNDAATVLLEEIGESSLSRAGSIIAVEHSHRQDLPLEVDGLRLIKQRRYGETMVTVYQQGGE